MGLFPRKDSSFTPPPPPPPPPPASQRRAGTRTEQPAQPIPAGSIGIGIETEFLLSSRDPAFKAENIRDFSRMVAAGYLQYISKDRAQHPRMHNAIDEAYVGTRFAEWSLDSDSTIEVPNKNRAPWGLENISPIFRVYTNSVWRSHVTMVWQYLRENFDVLVNDSCGTHVHLSIAEGFSVPNLKNIAQSIIHFEPAFEALMPPNRRANPYARSNWIDNPNFAYKKLTRSQAIDVIEQCRSIREIVLLMNPNHDKMFGWNFLYLLNSPHGTVEFRRGAASTSAVEVFKWVELAMSFMQASMRLGSPANLARVPRTVGGLRWFIDKAGLPNQVPGMNDTRYLNAIFAGVPEDAHVSPLPLGKLSKDKEKRLLKKKEEDKAKNVMMSKIVQPPYWG